MKPWSDEDVYMMEEIWDVQSIWNWHQWTWGEYYAAKRMKTLSKESTEETRTFSKTRWHGSWAWLSQN